ncbi:uncharacterized protein EV420DRAFT_1496164 [Desarmillaria tabescens]|uniref:F-box domain-containing protein n=1 Tax=Armillaria tabescens TaxID=1929756 RepID=A0AA39U8N9_ARMTA|nr:uncharacterized protein EV420DRAFT_1496164 [Desarmillaria tabescens]KAK0469695.1 hypothetical protein EV420DRAFT_1496164 [Desarmillaria tabescens]
MALAFSVAPIQPVSHIAAPGSASSYPQHLLQHMSSFSGSESPVAATEPLSGRLEPPLTTTSISTTSSKVNRPLPSLPRTNSVTGSSAVPTTMAIPTSRPPRKKALNSPVSYFSHLVSALMPQRKAVSSVTSIVNHPGTLSRLLSFLPWPDFLALSQTCRSLRDILDKEDLRDVILSRYVEGYGTCLRLRSGSREGVQEVPITLHDLDLLLISQRTPLHIYPTAALSTLSSRRLSNAEILRNQKLERLTHTHSRFVLLLQSLAHSSSLPPPLESEPESDPIFPETRTQSQGPSFLQRVSLVDGSGTGSVRELVFPAPLSCPDPVVVTDRPVETPGRIPQRRSVSAGAVQTDGHRHTRSLTSTAHYLHSSRSRQAPKSTGLNGGQAGTIRSPDSSASLRSMKRKNRLSIFSSSANNPPPPPADPRDLKYYSTGWRRSLANASFAHKAKRASSAHDSSISEGWLLDDDLGFYRPHRRFASSNFSGSNHSFSSTSGSASGSGGSPLSRSERHSSPSPPLTPVAMPSPSSPHDLVLATSRVRAPILRVYVPCTELSDGPEFLDKDYFLTQTGGSSSIQRCEDQLIESGLWEHMSTGDVVCNLGYVPPAPPGSEESSVEDHSSSREFSSRRDRFDRLKETRTWLIFNGHCLVPFCPPDDMLPIDDPISLPSPFYYDCLIPATPLAVGRQRSSLATGNIRMVIGRLPPPGFEEVPQLRLIHTQTRVRSPHSRGGVAVVKKWVWIAKVWRGGLHFDAVGKMNANGSDLGAAMGIGWEGEWVIEGEGTKEGRQALLDCLNGKGPRQRECEIVREKSGGGRIWLRMLESSSVQLYTTPSNSGSISSALTQTASQPRV